MPYGTSQTRDRTKYPFSLNPNVALSRMGFDLNHPARGSIVVRTSPGSVKRYAFRYRVGDGHILTRWGRVVRAECIGQHLYVFEIDPK